MAALLVQNYCLTKDNKGSVIIIDLIYTNVRFADRAVVHAEAKVEADDIVTSIDTACTRYKMEIGPEKTK